MPSEPAPGYLPQQAEMQNGAVMQFDYTMQADSQAMWAASGQMQGNECWEVPLVDQTDYSSQCTYVHHTPQIQQQQILPDCPQLMAMSGHPPMPPQAQQQPQMPLQLPFQGQQMAAMAMDDPSPHMLNMPSPHGQMQLSHLLQMDLPQTPMSQISSESTPSEIDRCMAIVMPQASQFACDRDLMAAQLKAAADCQCYED